MKKYSLNEKPRSRKDMIEFLNSYAAGQATVVTPESNEWQHYTYDEGRDKYKKGFLQTTLDRESDEGWITEDELPDAKLILLNFGKFNKDRFDKAVSDAGPNDYVLTMDLSK